MADCGAQGNRSQAQEAAGAGEVLTEVRIATREDEPQILQLLHLMHAEGGLFPLDEDRAREMFAKAFDRKGGIIGVIGPTHNIEAAIGLLITSYWYTSDNHIEEYFNFVRPDRRQSTHAKTLIAFAKKCSEAIEIPLVIGVLTNNRMAAKVRLYRGQLGHPSGAFFVVNSKWNITPEPNPDDFWEAVSKNGSHDFSGMRKVPKGASIVMPDDIRRIGDGDPNAGYGRLAWYLREGYKTRRKRAS
jgi:hypothetical protein